jgi:dihydropteroate synthase
VNLALLDHAGDLGRALDRPVVIGASRKRFLRVTLAAAGQVAPTTADLDAATVGASLRAARSGARVLRVHNVALLAPALTVYTKE